MELKDILQLVEAARESGFDVFELQENDFSLRLEKNKPIVTAVAAAKAFSVPAAPAAQAAVSGPGEEAVAASAEHSMPEGKDILSPLVGVYHEANKPAKIGDKLKKGDVVCMVEAMKLMNEIEMPEDGEIVWVAAGENDTVEYEQLLFRYTP